MPFAYKRGTNGRKNLSIPASSIQDIPLLFFRERAMYHIYT